MGDNQPFQIGAIRVEPTRNVVLAPASNGGRIDEHSLEPRVMAVLLALSDAAPDVVTRDALLEQVWPASYGADESLTRAVSLLRRVFKAVAGPDAAQLIETIPKRGYRLTALPVSTCHRSPSASSTPIADALAEEQVAKHRPRRWLMYAAIFAVVLLTGAGLLFQQTLPPDIATGDSPELQDPVPAGQTDATIAVLPFAALSKDEEDRIFADGLAAQLLTTLGKIAGLRVANRRSSFAYRNDERTAEDIGAALKVAYLLDGTVQRIDDRLRVTANLIRTADGATLWAEAYDRDRRDLGKVQDVIVRKVSRQLAIELGVGEFSYRTAGEGVSAQALEQYYLGLGYFGDRMLENDARRKAYDAFRYATELAPEFADAWAGMALVGSTSLASPLARDRDLLVRDVEQAFARALDLDDSNAVVHAARAFWHLTYRFDPDLAKYYGERALALNPDLREAQYTIIGYLALIGEVDAVRALHERQLARNPGDLNRQLVRASFLAEVGDTDEAFAFFDACNAQRCLQEGFVAFASFYAALSGDPERVDAWRGHWEVFESVLPTLPPSAKPEVTKILPGLFSILADRSDKAEQVDALRALYAEAPITEYAGLWAPVLADYLPEDGFFGALELAVSRGDLFGPPHSLMPFYGTNPYPDWVLRHPRYHALFERPELARFAELRRQNGWLQGLPKAMVD